MLAMCQGLHTILDSKESSKSGHNAFSYTSLLNEMKSFYANFEIEPQTQGQDGLQGEVVRACELAGMIVPRCLIMHLPSTVGKRKLSCNDWRPIALTPIVSTCFERYIKDIISNIILDLHQFAHRLNSWS